MRANRHVDPIANDVQDRNSDAWKALCRYVDELADSGGDEFSPREALGPELFASIHTLPESIAKLKQVTKVWLYGSKLKRIPPEIGEMSALKYLDVYTSYGLQWFPYEITRCRNLVDSRVSTRALYGNYKYRLHFPWLKHNPVRYEGDTLKCSVCNREIGWDQTWQLWISLRVGTDVLPLLVNSCSRECTESLPVPPPDYVPNAHRGGTAVAQPSDQDGMLADILRRKREAVQTATDLGPQPEKSIVVVPAQGAASILTHVPATAESQQPAEKPAPLKVIWKIWEK